jgi:hypothetical protein
MCFSKVEPMSFNDAARSIDFVIEIGHPLGYRYKTIVRMPDRAMAVGYASKLIDATVENDSMKYPHAPVLERGEFWSSVTVLAFK